MENSKKHPGDGLPWIAQDQRVCNSCGTRFLSGVMQIERGEPKQMLCKDCAKTVIGGK